MAVGVVLVMLNCLVDISWGWLWLIYVIENSGLCVLFGVIFFVCNGLLT